MSAKSPEKVFVSTSTTSVRFNQLDSDIIDWYLKSNEWKDKAGGYGIQGKGRMLVQAIKGCYYNVVGLPVNTLYKVLLKAERHHKTLYFLEEI